MILFLFVSYFPLVKLSLDGIDGLNQSFLIVTLQHLSQLDEFGALVVACEQRSNLTFDPSIKIREYTNGQKIVPMLVVHPAIYDRMPDKTGVIPMTKEMVYHSLAHSLWVPHSNSLYRIKSLGIIDPQIHLWNAAMLPFATPRQLQASNVRFEQLEDGNDDDEFGELPFTGTAIKFRPKDLGIPKSCMVNDNIIGWVPALDNVTIPPSTVPPSPYHQQHQQHHILQVQLAMILNTQIYLNPQVHLMSVQIIITITT